MSLPPTWPIGLVQPPDSLGKAHVSVNAEDRAKALMINFLAQHIISLPDEKGFCMVDGFYTAKFKTHESVEGAGVVVMRAGKLIGGDNAYKYIGKYAEKDGTILVDVIAERFAPGISVFGDLDRLELTFIATVENNGVRFSGTLVKSAQHKLEVVLERQLEMV